MILKQELVKRIRDYFNLNIYETKVWLALLSKGIASAREVADISSVPRSRTYDVLESLEKRGFAITKIGKPVKYMAVNPKEVIEKMKSNTFQEAQEKVKTLSTLNKTPEYAELEQLHKSGFAPIKTHEITGSLRGRANILGRLRELLENAQHEVIIYTTENDFENKGRVLIPALERLNKANIKVKLALSGDAEKIKKISVKHNLKPKVSENSARLFVADKKETMLMITPENSEEELAIWLNSPYFTESLSKIVDTALKNGIVAKA